MPRLLQINSCVGIKSTGRITENIAKLAIANGWECYMLHGAKTVGNTIQHHFQVTSLLGTYFHFAESFLLDRHGLGSRIATKRIIKTIERIQPDVVQLHNVHGYYINYRILFEYFNQVNIPVVWTFHDCWAFTGHCAHFIIVNCTKWKEKGCRVCPLKGNYPKSITDFSSRNFMLKKKLFGGNNNLHIVTVSKWLENLARTSFFHDKDIRTIYNGLDINIFKPQDSNALRKKLHLEGKSVLIAAATAWSKGKGLNDYNKLSEMLPDGVKIILIGLTKNQRKDVSNKILGLPRTDSQAELAEYYSMADIVLNLSYSETFGLTTAEGMSCGTPGVVYNVTASPELITPITGKIVEAGDVKGVFEAVTEILNRGKLYYSENCRKRALDYFDMNKQYKKYIELYDNLAHKKN